MHFKNGFKDANSQRYMLETRVKKLINMLRAKFWYDAAVSTGIFDKAEGLIAHEDLKNAEWERFDGKIEKWGGPNQNVWFRQTFTIPEEMDGKTVVYAANLSGETDGWYWGAPQVLAYLNGKAVTGMDVNHRDIVISNCAKAGTEYTVELCAFTDRIFYKGQVEMNMGVYAVNTAVRDLYYDLVVPFEVSEQYPSDDTRHIDIMNYLNTAVSLVDYRLPKGEEFNKTVKAAADYLQTEFYGKYCGHEDVVVTCTGHTHIDTAWLWTLEQTRKKVARSFSTVVDLMDRYDEYEFMSSQPQLYEYLREMLPETHERMQELVKSGRWQPEGGMWVEADTNIPSGESLVRQFLIGKNYFNDEFGQDNKILWLPDVFGYSGALPQIMKKSGVDYFMTTKISWNEYNKLPFDTFRWRGIDGSEVLSHFICTQHADVPESEFLTTYNGYLSVPYVIGAWDRYQQKDLNRDILFSFGFGDGGGGPNTEMLEYARRMGKGIPGCPKVKMGQPREYFKKLDAEVCGNKRLPVWSGELYFEYHRGTYTTIAKIKKNMRKGEILLHDAELWSSMAMLNASREYPKDKLTDTWKLLLLNQFHDILPGSSIKEVYDDSDAQFAEIKQSANEVLSGAMSAIAGKIALTAGSLVVFNSTSFIRDDIVEFTTGRTGFVIKDGENILPYQKTEGGGYIFRAPGIPANGYKSFALENGVNPETSPAAAVSGRTFDTDLYTLMFDGDGNISSFFHKGMEREMVRNGAFNRLVAFEDVPPNDDAWNINAYYNEKTWNINSLDSFDIVENGAVRCVVRVKRSWNQSAFTQDFILVKGSERVDVKSTVDWKETDILLKADFPFDINASRATFDIQFGNVERSTNENTSWDFAQFEVCAHRWADLSEEGYGLSILNDCKYGYDTKRGHIRLSLLRSPLYPNPEADREIHEFVYSIYPHKGTWKQARTVQEAAFLNMPAYVIEQPAQSGSLPPCYSLVQCSEENVIVDTVKQAEDGRGVIVRLFENQNKTTRIKLTFAQPVKSASLCDLMEKSGAELAVSENVASLELKPFEIVTLRAEF